jgi:hypothetical protein
MTFARATDWERLTVRQRVAGVAATLIIEALLVLILLSLGLKSTLPTSPASALVTVKLGAQPQAPKPPKSSETAREDARTRPQPPLPKVPVPTNPRLSPPKPPATFLEVSKEDFAAMDISKFGSKGKAGKSGPPSSMGPGEGPDGQPLYNAEWVREPTDGELELYLAEVKSRPAGAWAMIACKTIPNNRVDDCRQLGESPPGSGLARALRLAAWQFRVRPPRVGNKTLLDVWVRIRFDFRRPALEAE